MAQGEPRWKVVRDWLSFAQAIVALAVSSTNSYVTGLRELSELRAVIDSLPIIAYDEKIKRFKVNGDASVLFKNAGNRPISVIGASIIFGEPIGDEHNLGHMDSVPGPINRCKGIRLGTDLSFLVIDEKKIIETKLKVDLPTWTFDDKFDFRERRRQSHILSRAGPFKKGNCKYVY